MRKIKLQVQISIDGFIAGPNGEMDWMVWDWDDILKKYVLELSDSVDTILVGSVTYKGMAGYWPAAAEKPEGEDAEFAKWMNSTPKIVFSKTLEKVEWSNSVLATDDILTEVKKLKQLPGKDIIIYGGAAIVSSFIKLNLIDEYHLFINPTSLGNGKGIFDTMESRLKLKHIKTTTSKSGIVILCYEPVKD